MQTMVQRDRSRGSMPKFLEVAFRQTARSDGLGRKRILRVAADDGSWRADRRRSSVVLRHL
jgi:hypothetical protein